MIVSSAFRIPEHGVILELKSERCEWIPIVGDPVKEDAVGPLAEKLGKAVENSMTEHDRLIQSGPDAVDDADEIWNEIIAPGFLCADALLSLSGWLQERVTVRSLAFFALVACP